jgi:N-acetylneuraminic acid mutarotase
MKKRAVTALTCIIIVLAASFMATKPVKASGDFWVEKAPMPNSEAGFGVVSVNGEIYAIGSNFNYMYNPLNDTWVSKTPMPSHRNSFAVAACAGKIYVVGGWNSTDPKTGLSIIMGTNEMYNPATDTWTTKASLPMATSNMQANAVGDKIYVISGLTNLTDPSTYYPVLSISTWIYDPTHDSWNEAARIPNAVFNYASAVVNGKIYIEGGEAEFAGISNLNQIYDPKTNTWAIGQPMPLAVRSEASGATTGKLAPARLYLTGGTHDTWIGVNTTQIYDPQTNNWTLGAEMPHARLELGVAVIDDTIYAIGGVSWIGWAGPENSLGTVYAINEQYVPSDNQASSAPPSTSASSSPLASQPLPIGLVGSIVAIVAVVFMGAFVVVFLQRRRERMK